VKYAIFTKDGEEKTRLEDPDNPGNELPIFEEHESVSAWLVEATRLEKIPPTIGRYAIELVDDDGYILEEVPEEEADLAATDANRLVKDNEDICQAVGTMIAARQMYAVATIELERLLDGLSEEEKPHPMTADVMIQTACRMASEPFDENILFQGLVETVFPWMQKICQKHSEEDIETQKAENAEAEKRRREVKVPIGVSLDPKDDAALTKGRHVVFVGYRPAIKVLLDHIATTVLAAHDDDHPQRLFTVIRLIEKASKDEMHERLVRLGKDDWEDCTRTNESFPKLVGEKIFSILPAMPDLLICDDMTHAHIGLHRSHEATRANETLKRLGRWAVDDAGAAFIGAIPLSSDKPPVMMGSEWERVRTHAVLRPVSISREDVPEGQVKIIVGKDAFEMVVDEEVLRPEQKLIVPE